VLPAAQPAQALVRYAREHNLVRVVMGRSARRWPWQATLAEQIGQSACDLDLLQVGTLPNRSDHNDRKATRATAAVSRTAFWPGYIAAALACCVAAVIATPLANVLELTNIVMLF
jgi:two-component system sensor histidine kinase KdpD